MHIFTQSIGFLTTDDYRPSVVSFLTCLRYIFNSSVIPEILSSSSNYEELLTQLVRNCETGNASWYRLFLQSHTMQFSPTLIVPPEYFPGANSSSSASDCDDDDDGVGEDNDASDDDDDGDVDDDDNDDDDDDDDDHSDENDADDDDDDDDESVDDEDDDEFSPCDFVKEIVLPLKKNMRYFSCTLQRCIVHERDLRRDTNGLLAILADVRSLIRLELQYCGVNVNEFLSLFLASSSRNQLEYLSISLGHHGRPEKTNDLPQGIEGQSFQRLREVALKNVHHTFAVKLLRHCPNLSSLDFEGGHWKKPQDLATFCPKLSAVKLIADDCNVLRLKQFIFNLPQLTSIDLSRGGGKGSSADDLELLSGPRLHFQLRVLKLASFVGNGAFDFSHIGKLRNLTVLHLTEFDKDLQDKDMHHFANLLCVRDLHIDYSKITSNGLVEITKSSSTPGSFLPQLVSLTLEGCELGGKAKSPKNLITFFSFCSTNLKKVSLRASKITNDDLSAELVAHWKRCGIETLNVSGNKKLDDNKKSGLVNLKQLTTLTELAISHLDKVTHFDFISPMQNLKWLDASFMDKLKPAAVAVFSQTPDSFLHLRTLNLSESCQKQRSGKVDKIVELLLKNDNIKYRLKWLDVDNVPEPKRYDVLEEMEKFHVAQKTQITWYM